jgi:hypothetical protein
LERDVIAADTNQSVEVAALFVGSHPHHRTIRPGVSGQHPLCSHRHRSRLARLAERDEEAAAFRADLAAVEPG